MTMLTSKYKYTADGTTYKGPLIADDNGIQVAVQTGTKRHGLIKKTIIYKDGYSIVRWDDVTGYEIGVPGQKQFAGSTINANDVIVTVKTAATQHTFLLHSTDEIRVRNKLGPYLAKVDARLGS